MRSTWGMLKGHMLSESLSKEREFHLPKDPYFLNWACMFGAQSELFEERVSKEADTCICNHSMIECCLQTRLSHYGSPQAKPTSVFV